MTYFSDELAVIPSLYLQETYYMRSHVEDISKPIVVTFHFAADIPTKQQVMDGASPFGFSFCKKNSINVVSISPVVTNNWYRDEQLVLFLEELSVKLKIFPEIIGYGSSMGGYAVSAFSDLIGIDRMLLLNPISTLNLASVPWETRFRNSANSLDWVGAYSDGSVSDKPGYVIFDPTHIEDRNHARRYTSLKKVYAFGAGHNVPKIMLDTGIIKTSFVSFYNQTLTAKKLNKLLRKSRELPYYYENIFSQKKLSSWRKNVLTFNYSLLKSEGLSGRFGYVDDRNIKVVCGEIEVLINEGRLNLALKFVNFALLSTSFDPAVIQLKDKIFKLHNAKDK